MVADWLSRAIEVNVGEIRERELNNEETDNFALTYLIEWAENIPNLRPAESTQKRLDESETVEETRDQETKVEL